MTPTADGPLDPLDPVARLHVLAAALPGSAVAERTLAATFEAVWPVVADLETMVPRYETYVDAVEIVDRHGDRARVVVTLRGGSAQQMDVRLVPGWCLMQSDTTVVAFAARPAGSQTVLAHLEHDRRSPSAWPAARPTSEEVHRKLRGELDAIERLATAQDPAGGPPGPVRREV